MIAKKTVLKNEVSRNPKPARWTKGRNIRRTYFPGKTLDDKPQINLLVPFIQNKLVSMISSFNQTPPQIRAECSREVRKNRKALSQKQKMFFGDHLVFDYDQTLAQKRELPVPFPYRFPSSGCKNARSKLIS